MPYFMSYFISPRGGAHILGCAQHSGAQLGCGQLDGVQRIVGDATRFDDGIEPKRVDESGMMKAGRWSDKSVIIP